MMQTRRSPQHQSALNTFLICGLLAAAASGFAIPSGAVEIPSVNASPEPRTATEEIKLAKDYLVGHGVDRDLQESAYWYKRAAESGDPQAQLQTGYFYDVGIGVAKDAALAAHWYQLAAANGLADAKANLGILYLWGNGVKKDQQLAFELFREGAEKGSGLAACHLGDMFMLGVSVPIDKSQAERWYLRGASLHDARAEYRLGLLFFDRPDHEHNLRKAAAFLRESAASGDVPAMFALGLLLERNPAMERSTDEAIRLLSDSAEAGVWKSSMILGVVSRDGRGVAANDKMAYFHFKAAALQGGSDAGKLLEYDLQTLANRLGPSETKALDSRAEEWYRQHQSQAEFVYKGDELHPRSPDYALALPENGSQTQQVTPLPSDQGARNQD